MQHQAQTSFERAELSRLHEVTVEWSEGTTPQGTGSGCPALWPAPSGPSIKSTEGAKFRFSMT